MGALVVVLAAGGACAVASADPAPVPSLTPAATQELWQQLVAQPVARPAAARVDCAPLRAVFYAATDWLRLATDLAADPSACAGYFVSVPPLVADKSQPRSDQAWRIRALGPSFHALAEINVTGWTSWVASNGGDWYAAGVEARRRMAAAGYDVAAGDTWALNELSSAVRQGTGAARANMRAFVHGLYDGDGGPAARGVVFVNGIGQSTSDLSTYQARLQDWYLDAGFWADMSAYVSDWSQEVYGDVRDYAAAGAPPDARREALNEYLQHETALAAVAPPDAAAAAAFLAGASSPLGNAAWQFDSAFGWTDVPVELMEDFVSAQVDADRSAGDPRFGFAWSPKNLNGMAASDFASQTDALLGRLAAAIADSGAAPGAACGAEWCDGILDGAALTDTWRTFETWRPSLLAFTSAPQTLAPGATSAPIAVALETATGVAYAAGLPVTVELASSSATGQLSAGAGGPWASTLELPIASGASTASFYFRDPQPGSPAITAAAADRTGATQTVTVAAAPDTTPPETALDSAPAGTVASSSASFAFSSSEPGSQFRCSLDGAAPAACSSPLEEDGLAAGSHAFAVFAIDAAGNADPTPATASWTVSTPAAPSQPAPSSGGASAPAPAPATPAPFVPPAVVVPPAPTRTVAVAAVPLTLAVVRPKTVVLGIRPVLRVTVRLNRPAALSLALLDAKGRTLARWTKRFGAGARTLALALPPRARRPGSYRLRVATGALTRVVPVTFRAPERK